MKTITLDKCKLLDAYNGGNADQKEMLEHLFGKDMFTPNWHEITSYEKACEWLEQFQEDYDVYDAWNGDYVSFKSHIIDFREAMEE